jgi:hypothetical protein
MEWLWQTIHRFGPTATLDSRVLSELEIIRERREAERAGATGSVTARSGTAGVEHARDTVAGAPR